MVSLSFFFFLTACSSDKEDLEALLGDWKPFDIQLEQSSLAKEDKDLLLLSLAVENPQYSSELCKKIQTKPAKEKCQQVIGRPHLQAVQQ